MSLMHKVINVKAPLTEEQLKELEAMDKMPIIIEEDCPEITEEEYEKYLELAKQRREERRKPLVSIRLSPETYERAKKLGKGYTGVLSRLLDVALSNPEMVRRCL